MVASTFVTLRAIEVSAVPLVVISEPNAVSNESTDPSARKTKEAKAVSLVVSTALINETISANVSVLAPADNKIASILFFSVVIEVANEVSPEPLAVISPDNAVSNESTEAFTAVTAVPLVVSSVEILVVNEVSAVALVASSVETLKVAEVSPEPLAVISPDKAVSKESIEAVCAVLMVSKEVIAVPWLVFTNSIAVALVSTEVLVAKVPAKVSKESTEAFCAVLIVSKEVTAVPKEVIDVP